MAPPRRGELSPEEKELLRVIATGGPRSLPPMGKGLPASLLPFLPFPAGGLRGFALPFT